MSVEPQALERSVLERKERDELAAIAEAMGVKANSRTSKANLIEGILREAGVEPAEEKPKRGKTAKADANGGETAGGAAQREAPGPHTAGRPAAGSAGACTGEPAPARPEQGPAR